MSVECLFSITPPASYSASDWCSCFSVSCSVSIRMSCSYGLPDIARHVIQCTLNLIS
jgi:hypothetical protein